MFCLDVGRLGFKEQRGKLFWLLGQTQPLWETTGHWNDGERPWVRSGRRKRSKQMWEYKASLYLTQEKEWCVQGTKRKWGVFRQMLTLRIPLAASHRKPFSRGLNKLWFIFLVASESCCGTWYPLGSGHFLCTPARLPEARTYNSLRAFSKVPEGYSALEGDEKCVFCMGSQVPQQDSAPGAQRGHTE